MGTVLGSILDPAADKLLMTTMVVTLAMKGMLPRKLIGLHCECCVDIRRPVVPLAGLILGRDVLLSLSAFYFRFASLPPPVPLFFPASLVDLTDHEVPTRKLLPVTGTFRYLPLKSNRLISPNTTLLSSFSW